MMSAMFMQFVFSGLAVGTIYALVALGFTIIYNSSNVINFAQGEFVMLGGMLSVFIFQSLGLPLYITIPAVVILVALVGVLMEKITIEPVKDADVITLIIITLGVSLIIRGIVQITLGKGTYTLPSFTGDKPIEILEAIVLPQTLWIFAVTAVVVALLWYFFNHTRTGKAMLAMSYSSMASLLVGINTTYILMLSFGLSAAIGALGGALMTPITMTTYDVGIDLGLKGFVAAVLGGMGSGVGAILGGLLVGLIEAMSSGYISSAYKDAIPFILIIFVLRYIPQGLLGGKIVDRV